MTEPRIVEGNHFRGMEYGYLWWIIDRQYWTESILLRNIYTVTGGVS